MPTHIRASHAPTRAAAPVTNLSVDAEPTTAAAAAVTNLSAVADWTSESPGRLLSVDEVAGVLGVPRAFVYALSRRGELPTVRIGERYVRYRAQTICEWIASQESTRPKGTQ